MHAKNMRLASVALVLVLGCGENLTPRGPVPFAPGEEPGFACLPNLDGTLEAGELPVAFDAPARYLVNPQGTPRPIDLGGTVDEDGRRRWDLSPDFADDRIASLAARPLRAQWFAAAFPQADYVAPIDLEGRVLGAYHLDERGLWLHGVASAEADPPEGRTLLPYDAPVLLFRLPMVLDDRWTSVGEVSQGTALGLAYRGTDTYDLRVLGAGRLDLPDWSFGQAWQVEQRVTVAPAIGAPIERRIVSWLFECFGEVARAEAPADALDPFTTAAELRRMTLR
jgi:hypothetical protein